MTRLKHYTAIMFSAVRQHWVLWLFMVLLFPVLYYGGLLLVAMLRFHEVPNYVEVYNIFHVYQQIFDGTPSMKDALNILIDEAWVEVGYKNPDYYGIATWSYLLIPPKMLVVGAMSLLVATFVTLRIYGREQSCPVKNRGRLYAAAGVGSGLVGMGSATLTWVACCATPSWVVGLSMLGLSSSLALTLQPFGKVINVLGMALVLWIIFLQLKSIASNTARLEAN